eukprot:3746571-Pyramimonas_sp.AAC.1
MHERGELGVAVLWEAAPTGEPLEHARGDRGIHHLPLLAHALHLETEHHRVALVGHVLVRAVLELPRVRLDGDQP